MAEVLWFHAASKPEMGHMPSWRKRKRKRKGRTSISCGLPYKQSRLWHVTLTWKEQHNRTLSNICMWELQQQWIVACRAVQYNLHFRYLLFIFTILAIQQVCSNGPNYGNKLSGRRLTQSGMNSLLLTCKWDKLSARLPPESLPVQVEKKMPSTTPF